MMVMQKIMRNENMFIRLKWLFLPLILASSSLLLTACGSSDADKASTTAQTKQSNSPTLKKPMDLDTTPINIGTLLTAEVEYTKIPECPFLTDKVALSAATLGGSFGNLLQEKRPRVRQSVSNKSCKWSNLNVFFQPAKTAKTLQKRAAQFSYIIKFPKGPGDDAAIVYKKSGKKKAPIPYSMGFTQGDNYVLISVDTSYYSTSEKQLQAVADEVARLLPNAPKIKEQQRTEVKPVDFCKVWDINALKGLYSLKDTDHINLTANRMGCGFTLYPPKNKIDLTLFVEKPNPAASCEKSITKFGYTKLNGAGDKNAIYKREETDSFIDENYKYCSDQADVSMRMLIDYSSSPDKEKEKIRSLYKTQTKLLFENLLKRVTF